MATYNGRRFVGAQLRSILEQSVPPARILLSDDGSDDETVEIARDILAGSDIELEVHRNPRPLGPYQNFSRALLHAMDSPMIILADQDDIWRSDRVERALAVLNLGSSELVVCDAELIDATGRPLGDSQFKRMNARGAELAGVEAQLKQLIRRNIYPGMSYAFLSADARRFLPVPEPWPHDYWLACHFAALGRMSILMDTLVFYRQHSLNAVGARQSSLRQRTRRLLAAPPHEDLATMFSALHGSLSERGADSETMQLVQGKIWFESCLANNPRPGTVGSLLRSGHYRRFSPNGSVDAIRDLAEWWRTQ